MASFALANTSFPDGTVVGAYDATGYTTLPANGPLGTPVTTATASGRAVSFTGIENATAYFAAAKVGGKWLWRRFVTSAASEPEAWEGSLAEEEAIRKAADEEVIPLITKRKPFPDLRDWIGYTESASDKGPQFNEALASAEGALVAPPWKVVTGEPLVVPSQTDLQGHFGSSIIELGDGSNCAILESDDYAGSGTHLVALHKLILDGNKEGNELGPGMLLNGETFRVSHCIVRRCAEEGLKQKITGEGEKSTSGLDSTYDFVYAIACNGVGIRAEAHDTALRDCQAIQCTTGGIFMMTNGLMSDCHTWCYSSDSTCTKVGMYFKTDVSAINPVAEGASEAQIQLAGANNRLFGGDVFDSSGKPNVPLVEFLAGENFGSHEINGTYLHNYGTGGALKFTGSGSNSKIRCHFFDPEGKPAGVGTPSESIVWDVTVGGSTTLGTIPGYHVQRRRTFAPFGGSVPNNTLYVNEEGILRFKNKNGEIKTVKVE